MLLYVSTGQATQVSPFKENVPTGHSEIENGTVINNSCLELFFSFLKFLWGRLYKNRVQNKRVFQTYFELVWIPPVEFFRQVQPWFLLEP